MSASVYQDFLNTIYQSYVQDHLLVYILIVCLVIVLCAGCYLTHDLWIDQVEQIQLQIELNNVRLHLEQVLAENRQLQAALNDNVHHEVQLTYFF